MTDVQDRWQQQHVDGFYEMCFFPDGLHDLAAWIQSDALWDMNVVRRNRHFV